MQTINIKKKNQEKKIENNKYSIYSHTLNIFSQSLKKKIIKNNNI